MEMFQSTLVRLAIHQLFLRIPFHSVGILKYFPVIGLSPVGAGVDVVTPDGILHAFGRVNSVNSKTFGSTMPQLSSKTSAKNEDTARACQAKANQGNVLPSIQQFKQSLNISRH